MLPPLSGSDLIPLFHSPIESEMGGGEKLTVRFSGEPGKLQKAPSCDRKDLIDSWLLRMRNGFVFLVGRHI